MINHHKITWFTINIDKYTSSHIHRIITNKFQQVYDSSVTIVHQVHNNTKHIIYTKHINNY